MLEKNTQISLQASTHSSIFGSKTLQNICIRTANPWSLPMCHPRATDHEEQEYSPELVQEADKAAQRTHCRCCCLLDLDQIANLILEVVGLGVSVQSRPKRRG